jgi:putative tryptophan/tyrosine transport system substrate-binding protein
MRRREFLVAAFFTGLVRDAEAQARKMYRIAVVNPADPVSDMDPTNGSPKYRTFFRELNRLGYVEGDNLVVARRSGEGRTDKYDELARDVVRLEPDAIFVNSIRFVQEFKNLTATIPIVGFMSDPVANGVVSNLARPDGNITGISADAGAELQQKRLELLKEAFPKASRIAYLTPRRVWEGLPGRLMTEAARQLGITLIGAPLDPPVQEAAYAEAFGRMVEAGVEALVVGDAPENYANRHTIIRWAEVRKLPAIYPFFDVAADGGLITYGDDRNDSYRRAADYVAKILKGAKPSELPIYRPTKFELSINNKTARAIGYKFQDTFLARADEVIE